MRRVLQMTHTFYGYHRHSISIQDSDASVITISPNFKIREVE